MSTYIRPYLTFQQQLEQLLARGLAVKDEAEAIARLRELGYYRLSAYWYPLRKWELRQDAGGNITRFVFDDFEPGSSFENAVDLYFFDKKLRLLVMEAVEHIEVAVRVDVAHYLGQKDPFAQVKGALLDGNFTNSKGKPTSPHQDWLTRLDELTRRSKETFVKHYRDKYGLPLPIWVSIEVWDFGLLSRFYEGMRYPDQADLAQRFGVSSPRLMKAWLRTLNYLRNIVAHHSRLWNRNMIDQPTLPSAGDMPMFDPVIGLLDASRPYAALCILSFLIRQVCPTSDWPHRLADHLEHFPTVKTPKIDLISVGCDPAWRQHPFWA